MDLNDTLIDLFGRIGEHVHEAVDGASPTLLTTAPAEGANTIGWLVWHLTRVQDHHVSELLDEPQTWVSGEWAVRFGTDADADNTGYGHSPEEVAAVRPESAAALVEYYEVVAARTSRYLITLQPADLDRIVDERFDPPVSLGVRLISVADDDIQHAGQASYVRGLIDRS